MIYEPKDKGGMNFIWDLTQDLFLSVSCYLFVTRLRNASVHIQSM